MRGQICARAGRLDDRHSQSAGAVVDGLTGTAGHAREQERLARTMQRRRQHLKTTRPAWTTPSSPADHPHCAAVSWRDERWRRRTGSRARRGAGHAGKDQRGLARRGQRTLRYCMRPVPVVRRRLAFMAQLCERIFAAGKPQLAQAARMSSGSARGTTYWNAACGTTCVRIAGTACASCLRRSDVAPRIERRTVPLSEAGRALRLSVVSAQL